MIYAGIHTYENKDVAERQKAAITEYAEKKHIKIDQWIVYDRTNCRLKLKKLQKGDTLLSAKLFRLGSDVYGIMKILQELLERGITVYSCEDALKFGNDIMSPAMAYCFGLAGDVARDVRSQLTQDGLELRRRAGKKLGRPRGSQNKKLLLSDRATEIRDLLKQGNSKAKIARLLNVDNATLLRFLKKNPAVQAEANA